MNDPRSVDEQIVEYVRATVRSEPPPDLVSSIIGAVDSAPPRRAWYAPFLPALASAAVVVIALGVALFLARPWMVADPSPSPMPSQSSTATAAPSADPTPTSSPRTDALLEPGDTVELAAVDPAGEWGTIRIQRGEDLGGYSDAEIGSDTFVVELFVEYDAARLPDPEQFGRPDWALRPTDPNAEHFFLVEPTTFDRYPSGVRPDPSLATYPGAIDIFSTPTDGWIAFQVQRREANLQLELVYWPAGFDEPAATILVREPGDPPAPVEPDERPQAPEAPEYVERLGLAFTVIDSAAADDLFSRPDTCTNPVDGYSVTFPDDWYRNTAIGDTPACSWFTPEFFEVDESGQPLDEIWISMSVIDGAIGYTGITQIYSSEEISIDGVSATRVESNPNRNEDPAYRRYWYVIPLDSDGVGPTFVAQTDTDSADDYELARAVLDRIMASLEFDR